MRDFESPAIRVKSGNLFVLDQRKIPLEEHWIECKTPETMIELIQTLAIRGAPLIGVGAALALAQFAETANKASDIRETAKRLRDARPTAVNLMRAMDEIALHPEEITPAGIVEAAYRWLEEDVSLCLKMAECGSALIEKQESILTHCNTGGLATAGVGTALGVIQKGYEQGKVEKVYVDETRPLLQGGRLTTWELKRLEIPYTLICDNMAATLMREGKVQRVFVGADRIALNGDTANKVGTYGLAISAKHHRVPFYIVAPHTTFDAKCPSGDSIPIEYRDDREVQGAHFEFGSLNWATEGSDTYNPSFDVTPVELITGFVTDRGYFKSADIGQFHG